MLAGIAFILKFMQVIKRQQRIERLSHFHSDCELNYARLQKLVGGKESGSCSFESGGNGEIALSIEVSEESKYSRLLRLEGRMDFLPWACVQEMIVRMYDDARMAEVISVDRQRVRLINYIYPNKDMYAPDEKKQLNHFLGRWLEHMLAEGLPAEC